MLYTNFETPNSLYRQLPFLKAIAKKHLLVVIFFQNTELEQMLHKPSEHIQEVYDKVIAEKFSFENALLYKNSPAMVSNVYSPAPKNSPSRVSTNTWN